MFAELDEIRSVYGGDDGTLYLAFADFGRARYVGDAVPTRLALKTSCTSANVSIGKTFAMTLGVSTVVYLSLIHI